MTYPICFLEHLSLFFDPRRYMLALAAIGKVCSILFFFGAWWCYIPPKQVAAHTADETDHPVPVLNNVNVNHCGDRY